MVTQNPNTSSSALQSPTTPKKHNVWKAKIAAANAGSAQIPSMFAATALSQPLKVDASKQQQSKPFRSSTPKNVIKPMTQKDLKQTKPTSPAPAVKKSIATTTNKTNTATTATAPKSKFKPTPKPTTTIKTPVKAKSTAAIPNKKKKQEPPKKKMLDDDVIPDMYRKKKAHQIQAEEEAKRQQELQQLYYQYRRAQQEEYEKSLVNDCKDISGGVSNVLDVLQRAKYRNGADDSDSDSDNDDDDYVLRHDVKSKLQLFNSNHSVSSVEDDDDDDSSVNSWDSDDSDDGLFRG